MKIVKTSAIIFGQFGMAGVNSVNNYGHLIAVYTSFNSFGSGILAVGYLWARN